MEENSNVGSNNSTQYLRSDNMNNTIDNKQRHTKEEDPMSASYTNPPLGDQDNKSTNGSSLDKDQEEPPSPSS